MGWLSRFYFAWFWQWYRTFEFFSKFAPDFKAGGMITALEIVLSVALFSIAVSYFPDPAAVSPGIVVVALVGGLIGAANYWVFLHDNRWIRLRDEYLGIEERSRRSLLWVAWCINTLIVAFFVAVMGAPR